MTLTRYTIQECTNQVCRLRFPLGDDVDLKGCCPRCGSPTWAAVTPVFVNDEKSLGRSTAGRKFEPSKLVIEALLDNIRSAWNVGSMFRTADGTGIRHMHLAGFTPTPEHPKVAPTALGAEKTIPWTHYMNSLDVAAALKGQGWALWALEDDPRGTELRPESIFEKFYQAVASPLLIIVGNEVFGVDPGLLELCNRVLWIPMLGNKRSLNVAVAFGIAAYVLRFGSC
jgi:tRNA G18 (ribose-2'-O)-methylase SpoU